MEKVKIYTWMPRTYNSPFGYVVLDGEIVASDVRRKQAREMFNVSGKAIVVYDRDGMYRRDAAGRTVAERAAAAAALDHCHQQTNDEAACPACGGHAYEAEVNGRRVAVTAYIFRSWTGPRWLDGKPYTGPSYYLGDTAVAV